MKKLTCFLGMVFFISFIICSQSLTIITPNGGEEIPIIKETNIRWRYSGTSEAVKLVLFRNGNKLGPIVKNWDISKKYYRWKAGVYSNNLAQVGGGYQIKIITMSGSTHDFSNTNFKIAGNLMLLSPNGGETWALGEQKDIHWISKGVGGPIGLVLYKGKIRIGKIAKDIPIHNKSMDWKVGELTNGTMAMSGEGYNIKIMSMDGQFEDMSDNSFDLQFTPVRMVTPLSPSDLAKRLGEILTIDLKDLYGGTEISKSGERWYVFFGRYPQGSKKRPIGSSIGPYLLGEQMIRPINPPTETNPDRELWYKYISFVMYGQHPKAEFAKNPDRLIYNIHLSGGVTSLKYWILTSDGSVYQEAGLNNYNNSGSMKITFNLEMDEMRGSIKVLVQKVEIFLQMEMNLKWPEAITRMQNDIKNWLANPNVRDLARDLLTQEIYRQLGQGKWVMNFEIVDESKIKVISRPR